MDTITLTDKNGGVVLSLEEGKMEYIIKSWYKLHIWEKEFVSDDEEVYLAKEE